MPRGVRIRGPLDAFVWLDRGIYRPGETVHVSALLRDAGGAPADIPARLRIRRPNEQVFWQGVPDRLGGAAFTVPVPLSGGAQAGMWTVEVLADPDAPPIGSTTFRVDAFVPERLEVNAGPVPGPLVGGQPLEVPVTARFLYGAPGAGLTGTAELRLSLDPEPFPQWRGWRFGLADETFAPDLQSFDIAETDEQGRSTLTLQIANAPDSTRPVKGDVTVLVAEPGGRTSGTRFNVAVRARGTLLAIRPAFQNDAVDANAEAAFEVAAVNPDGAAIAANLRLRLVRERPDWRIVLRDRVARYETVWRDEPVDATDIRVAPGAPARFARSLPFGRYRIEVTEPNGLAIASYRFRSGWAMAESPEVPDRVDLAAERRGYAPGETARIRITPPFAGRASIAVLTDRLVSTRRDRRRRIRHRHRRAGRRRMGAGRVCRRHRLPRGAVARGTSRPRVRAGLDRARSRLAPHPRRDRIARPDPAAHARRGAGAARRRHLRHGAADARRGG